MTTLATPCFPNDPAEPCEIHDCHEFTDGMHHFDAPCYRISCRREHEPGLRLCVCGAVWTPSQVRP